jgi:hypothetical protein
MVNFIPEDKIEKAAIEVFVNNPGYTIYATRCDAVYNHYYIMATSGDMRAFT